MGIIHRDVKPANIILTVRGGEPDIAKVVDFGLVKRLDAAPDDATMSLDAGPVLAGTPLYFSPEAISAPDQVEARSDLYALGAVAYYLVTGQPLFEGATIMALCAHHLHTRPIPPSVRAGRPIDSGLEALVMQCLAKTPADRPASAAALESALAACHAAADWSPDLARRWWAEHEEVNRPSTPARPGRSTVTMAVDVAGR